MSWYRAVEMALASTFAARPARR